MAAWAYTDVAVLQPKHPDSDERHCASQGGESVPASSGAAADDAPGAGQSAGGRATLDPKPTGFKAAREAARRADAGNRAAWNTLFMRPDTVAAAVAAHYGVSKSELLDRDAEGPPECPQCTPYLCLHKVFDG